MHPHRTYLILATFLLAVCLWLITQDAPGLCNDTSRLAAADALVNYGTLQIDQSYFNYTCDRIKVADHFFSDKPPVLAVLYAAGLFLVQNLFGLSLPDDLPLIYRLLSLLFAGLPFGVIAALLFRTSQRNRWPVVWGLFFAIGLPACTQLLVFSSTLNSHIVGGMLVLWALVRFYENQQNAWTWFLMGLAVVVDPLAVAFVVSWCLCQWRMFFNKENWVAAGTGLLLPLFAHSVLCWLIAEHPFALNLNPEHFRFEGSQHTTETLTGVGLKHASPTQLFTYAFHSLVGHHGFLTYNACVVVALGALWQSGHRRVRALTFSTLLIFFGLTVLFSNNHSGDAFGNRWHVLMVPLSLFGLFIVPFDKVRANVKMAPVLLAALLWGGFLSLTGLQNPWTPNVSEEPSFLIQYAAHPPYDTYELKRATWFLEAGRLHEARAQGELALKRVPAQPEAWRVVVTSAIYRNDRERLSHYLDRLAALPLPQPFKSEITAAVRKALQSESPPSPPTPDRP